MRHLGSMLTRWMKRAQSEGVSRGTYCGLRATRDAVSSMEALLERKDEALARIAARSTDPNARVTAQAALEDSSRTFSEAARNPARTPKGTIQSKKEQAS